MKLSQFFLLLLLSSSSVLNAQSTPDPSAAMEVRSTTQGFLPPRMTAIQRDAISSPANGLMIYNTTTKEINVYQGIQWENTVKSLTLTTSLTAKSQLVDDATLGLRRSICTFIQGDMAYTASFWDDALQPINISDPTHLVGYIPLISGTFLQNARDVFVQGNYAYVASLIRQTVTILDIRNPTRPVPVNFPLTGDSIYVLYAQGSYVYAAYREGVFRVVDIGLPSNPVEVGQLTDSGSLLLGLPTGIFVQGNYAYVASYGEDGLQVIDISDPTNPVGVGQLTDDGSLLLDGAASVFVQGNYAYVVAPYHKHNSFIYSYFTSKKGDS